MENNFVTNCQYNAPISLSGGFKDRKAFNRMRTACQHWVIHNKQVWTFFGGGGVQGSMYTYPEIDNSSLGVHYVLDKDRWGVDRSPEVSLSILKTFFRVTETTRMNFVGPNCILIALSFVTEHFWLKFTLPYGMSVIWERNMKQGACNYIFQWFWIIFIHRNTAWIWVNFLCTIYGYVSPNVPKH